MNLKVPCNKRTLYHQFANNGSPGQKQRPSAALFLNGKFPSNSFIRGKDSYCPEIRYHSNELPELCKSPPNTKL